LDAGGDPIGLTGIIDKIRRLKSGMRLNFLLREDLVVSVELAIFTAEFRLRVGLEIGNIGFIR
jgi:hypothetical protein